MGLHCRCVARRVPIDDLEQSQQTGPAVVPLGHVPAAYLMSSLSDCVYHHLEASRYRRMGSDNIIVPQDTQLEWSVCCRAVLVGS